MIHFWIATKAIKPGIPRNPETVDIAKLMGTSISKRLPALCYRRSKNNAPINNLTTLLGQQI